MTYRIRDWAENFENHRSRPLKTMDWFPLPNNLANLGYCELVDDEAGPAHFAVWIVLLQIASRCEPRGTLTRPDGRPHDAASIARMSRFPKALICAAMARLCEISWLETIDITESETYKDSPEDGAVTAQKRVKSAQPRRESPETCATDSTDKTDSTDTESAVVNVVSKEPPISQIKLQPKPLSVERRPPANHAAMEKRIRDYEFMRASLIEFPGAESLPGKPDDQIVKMCLDVGNWDRDLIGGSLRRMAFAWKKPEISWAWFPKVLGQYCESRDGPALVDQREERVNA